MFTINTNTKLIIPDPNKLLIPEFKKLWVRDKTKSKNNALEDLSFMYYTCDFKSPYVNGYTSDKLIEVVKQSFISREKWKIDKDIQAAIDKYKELQDTKTIKLFKAADKAIDNLINYFESVNLTERKIRDENNNIVPDDKVHDIAAKIMNNLQKVAPVASAIEDARKKVERELSVKENAIRGKGSLKSREMPKNRR